jgi:hypothetical protein
MNDFANAIGQYFMDLLVSVGVIPFVSDDYVTPMGYFILAILIIIILFSLRKSISGIK